MNNESTFESTLDPVVGSPNLPPSQGPFELTPARTSLEKMEVAGQDVIEAQGIHSQAVQELSAIEGVSKEVSAAARDALNSTLVSLERQSKSSKFRGEFWDFVRGSFLAKDPSAHRAEQARTQLDSGIGYIMETGEAGRAMSIQGQTEHLERRDSYARSYEKASEQRPLSLRERIFNYANEKALANMARHDRLNRSIGVIREEIGRVVAKVTVATVSQDSIVEKKATDAQKRLEQVQTVFQGTISNAQDANYRGYSVPEV